MKLDLTSDQALVLFELLSRLQETGHIQLSPIDEAECVELEHAAEGEVLSAMLAKLERELVEPFRPDYGELLEQARARMCSTGDAS
jgi:hypothetical protein